MSAQSPASFVCPCCGYAGLAVQPYARLTRGPVPDTLRPPYEQHFGAASYDVCSCCGFEFGNDDEPGTAPPKSFGAYLAEWIEDGAEWLDASARPKGWSLDEQLRLAGIRKPT